MDREDLWQEGGQGSKSTRQVFQGTRVGVELGAGLSKAAKDALATGAHRVQVMPSKPSARP